MNEHADKRIIATSRGLECKVGIRAIKSALKKCLGEKYSYFLCDKTIMICTIKRYGIDDLLMDAAVSLGFIRENIVIWDEEISDGIRRKFDKYDVCYISGGNTFEICQMLRMTGADYIIKKSVREGGYFIGASAGAMLATSSIEFAADFDSNDIIGLTDFEGLNLLPSTLGKATLIPHYNKKEFMRWRRNTPDFLLQVYDYIDYIPDTKYRLY